MLGELLVGAGLVSEAEVLAALRGQRASGLPLGHYLVRSGMLSEDALVRVLSQQLDVPIVDLDTLTLQDDALKKVAVATARANAVVPCRLEGRVLTVATADPTRDEVADELRVSSHCDIRFVLATHSAIDRGLERGYGGRAARPIGAGFPASRAPAEGGAKGARTLEQRIATLEAMVGRLVGLLVMHDLASDEDFPELK